MNKQQLAQKIWASANQMRSKIEASEYKDFILGFIFYKYLSDKEIEFLKNNKLRASDIKRIADTVASRMSIPKFSRVVSRDEIRSNDYNLNIPRYVDSSEAAEHWDVYASMFGGIPTAEIDELGEYWTAFPHLRGQLFTQSSTPYVSVAVDDIRTAIKQSSDVVAFENAYGAAFASFAPHLKSVLPVFAG